jgi:hypothetical protein
MFPGFNQRVLLKKVITFISLGLMSHVGINNFKAGGKSMSAKKVLQNSCVIVRASF